VIDGVTYAASGGRGGFTGNSATSANTFGGSRGGSGTVRNYDPEVNTNNGGEGLPLFGDSTQSKYGGGGGGACAIGGGGSNYSGAEGSPHGTAGVGLNSLGSNGRNSKPATNSGGSGALTSFGQNPSWGDKFYSGKGGDGFVAFRKAV